MAASEGLRESSSVGGVESIKDDPLPELTREQIRLRIAAKTGIRTRYDTPFTLLDLNSIHAYLTGTFIFRKRHYRTPLSPDHKKLRIGVALAADVTGYTPSSDDLSEGETFSGRAFNKGELIQLCEAIESSADERPGSARRHDD